MEMVVPYVARRRHERAAPSLPTLRRLGLTSPARLLLLLHRLLLHRVDLLLRDLLEHVAPVAAAHHEVEGLELGMDAIAARQDVRVDRVVGPEPLAGEAVLFLPRDLLDGVERHAEGWARRF